MPEGKKTLADKSKVKMNGGQPRVLKSRKWLTKGFTFLDGLMDDYT